MLKLWRHAMLVVTDVDKSVEFYKKVLSFRNCVSDEEEMYLMYKN